MNIFLNILIIIIVSIITNLIFDFIKSYLLTKKFKKLSSTQVDSWSDFWNNIPIKSTDFVDKEWDKNDIKRSL